MFMRPRNLSNTDFSHHARIFLLTSLQHCLLTQLLQRGNTSAYSPRQGQTRRRRLSCRRMRRKGKRNNRRIPFSLPVNSISHRFLPSRFTHTTHSHTPCQKGKFPLLMTILCFSPHPSDRSRHARGRYRYGDRPPPEKTAQQSRRK